MSEPTPGRWLIAGTPTDLPYPCMCRGRRRCDYRCWCRGRADVDNLPEQCCARRAAGQQQQQ